MSSFAQAALFTPNEILLSSPVRQAANGLCYASAGQTTLQPSELEQMAAAIPQAIASALTKHAFYFVPLAIARGEETLIAERYDVDLSEQAVCHRTVKAGVGECIFISTRLMEDRFGVAFEFYLNVAHSFVSSKGFSQEFIDLVWRQALDGVKGESSLDAHELRRLALAPSSQSDKAKKEYFETTFADAIAIYMISVAMDVDYYDLREREYPLLAPTALAERLRTVAKLFPPPTGFEFNVYHKRKP